MVWRVYHGLNMLYGGVSRVYQGASDHTGDKEAISMCEEGISGTEEAIS